MDLKRLFDSSKNIVFLHTFRKVRFDRKGSSGNAKDWNSTEIVAESFGAERRRCYDEFEVGSTGNHLSQYAKENIGIQRSFVSFVHHNAAVLVQIWII
mmetsp:Transcript_40219/g.115583  ORF Transcript_40219/g.115583 Transcript_40219/m.115583 type:complete len:98 (-) Transcript_40219:561-854(-)